MGKKKYEYIFFGSLRKFFRCVFEHIVLQLSRALRNRFTEIWCETYYDKTDFVAIIEHNVKQGLSLGNQQDGTSGFGRAIFDFALWLKNNCPTHVK